MSWRWQPFENTIVLSHLCRIGDFVLTFSTLKWRDLWPPSWTQWKWFFKMKAVHWGIFKYQKKLGRKYPGVIHVVWVTEPGKFFEFTHPKARFGDLSECRGRKVVVCRPIEPFDSAQIIPLCQEILAYQSKSDYDEGEIIEHIDGILLSAVFGAKWGKKLDKILHLDDPDKSVCSSGVGMLFTRAGGNLGREWQMLDPAWLAQPEAPFAVRVIEWTG